MSQTLHRTGHAALAGHSPRRPRRWLGQVTWHRRRRQHETPTRPARSAHLACSVPSIVLACCFVLNRVLAALPQACRRTCDIGRAERADRGMIAWFVRSTRPHGFNTKKQARQIKDTEQARQGASRGRSRLAREYLLHRFRVDIAAGLFRYRDGRWRMNRCDTSDASTRPDGVRPLRKFLIRPSPTPPKGATPDGSP